jgi:TPR repeat protein
MSRYSEKTSRRTAPRRGSSAFVRQLASALIGLALIGGAPATTLADTGEGAATGRVADLGYADALAALRAAAKDNDVHAQETLGFMYLCAESRCAPGIARDPDEAQYWLKRAAAQGSMVAAYQLAWLRGESHPQVAAKQD